MEEAIRQQWCAYLSHAKQGQTSTGRPPVKTYLALVGIHVIWQGDVVQGRGKKTSPRRELIAAHQPSCTGIVWMPYAGGDLWAASDEEGLLIMTFVVVPPSFRSAALPAC